MTHIEIFKYFTKAFPALAEGASSYSNVRGDNTSITVLMKNGKRYKFTVTDKTCTLSIERRHLR